jgi:hypothetical protein
MKAVFTKAIFFVLAAVILAFTAKAGVGIKPVFITNSMELTQVNATTVQIKANIVSSSDVTFEIQKSYDNKNFSTVAVVFGTDDASFALALKLNDKVNKTEVFYRVVKMKTNNTLTVVTKSTVTIK